MLTTVLQDLRYAARTFLKSPGFFATAILTLALGIGANTAIFTLVHSILVRPLPYPEPDRLVVVWQTDRNRGTSREGASAPDLVDWQERNRVFATLAASLAWKKSLTGETGEPEHVTGASVTPSLFPMLAARPFLGRGFVPAEGRPGGARVAIVSYGFWRSRFAGDRRALGQTIILDGVPYEIVGVLPPSFLSPGDRAEVCWIPLQIGGSGENRGQHTLLAIGRLKPGVTIAQAQADMTPIMAQLEREYPQDNRGRGVRIMDLREADIGPIRPALQVLFAAVALVLLVICVNFANAMLARSLARLREIAIRTALGAARARLVRQLLTESILLALAGGGLGLLLALWGVRALRSLGSAALPRMDEIGVDGIAFAFTAGLSLLAGVLVGLTPALQLSRPDLQAALKEGGSSTASPRRQRLRKLLVVGQVALAMVLAISAGLLVKSFARLRSVDPGFDPRHLLKAELQLPEGRYPRPDTYPDWPQAVQFYSRALQSLREIPGVESAALALNHPLAKGWTTELRIDGRGSISEGGRDEVRFRPVTPGYFRTVRQPLLRGRDLTDRDVLGAPPVILVNETLARRYFAGESPLGRRISFWDVSREIVGVVADDRFMGLAAEVEPAVYPPLAQTPSPDLSLLVRTRGHPAAVAAGVRRAIRELDGTLALSSVAPMEDELARQVAQSRFQMLLLGGFALLALTLATLGLYGLILHGVTQRTQEIGVRLALGARREDILKLVMGQGMRLVLWGLAAGLFLSLLITRGLSSLLFGVGSHDWQTFLLVGAALTAAGLLACSLPSLRAARVDPLVATKSE